MADAGLEKLLKIHKNNLARLQKRAAKYNTAPLYLAKQIKHEQQEIRRIGAQLK